VIRVEGVVTANEWARLEETDSDQALREGKTTLSNVVWYDDPYIRLEVRKSRDILAFLTWFTAQKFLW